MVTHFHAQPFSQNTAKICPSTLTPQPDRRINPQIKRRASGLVNKAYPPHSTLSLD